MLGDGDGGLQHGFALVESTREGAPRSDRVRGDGPRDGIDGRVGEQRDCGRGTHSSTRPSSMSACAYVACSCREFADPAGSAPRISAVAALISPTRCPAHGADVDDRLPLGIRQFVELDLVEQSFGFGDPAVHDHRLGEQQPRLDRAARLERGPLKRSAVAEL